MGWTRRGKDASAKGADRVTSGGGGGLGGLREITDYYDFPFFFLDRFTFYLIL